MSSAFWGRGHRGALRSGSTQHSRILLQHKYLMKQAEN